MKNTIFFILLSIPGFLCSVVAQTTAPLLTLNTEMHTASINGISTDSAGHRILTCSTDKTAKLWNAETGIIIQTFRIPIDEGREGMLVAGAISPDGSLVALSGWTGYTWDKSVSIYIFDVNTNSLKKKIPRLRDVVTDLEFSHDGHFMVATLEDGKGIKVFKTGDWNALASPSLYLNCSGCSKDAAFDHTGRLAVACKGGSIWVYSPAFKLIKILETKTGKKPNSVAFSPDGTMLAAGYEDSYKIQVYDSQTFELLYEPDVSGADSLSGHLINVSFSSDGMYLIAGGSYAKKTGDVWWRQIRIWSDQGRGKFVDFPAGRNIIHVIKPMPDNSVIFCGGDPDFGRMRMDGARLFFKNSETNSYTSKDRTQFKANLTGSVIGVTPFGASPLTFSVEDRTLKIKE
jgi:WD40 repeat protein